MSGAAPDQLLDRGILFVETCHSLKMSGFYVECGNVIRGTDCLRRYRMDSLELKLQIQRFPSSPNFFSSVTIALPLLLLPERPHLAFLSSPDPSQELKWLALDKEQNMLSIETTANQDPLVTKGSALVALFGIDVWEHAYYLRPHSLDNWAIARECKDVKIDRVCIGSCTGGKTEDFMAAAKVFLVLISLFNQSKPWINSPSCRTQCAGTEYTRKFLASFLHLGHQNKQMVQMRPYFANLTKENWIRSSIHVG
ncbi:Superoxide dismutase [Mn] 3.4, mitochondrial [Morella rubra]|uniref:superoxide dismutase n=1 Tax=Morella rubra TaxID=262757 RepID=A0A6A1VED6_9ROSI|nr:Superoxide dismutase [Mn] 3.4, mitochondrial [Morella rubra]